MRFSDLAVTRPVLATVVNLLLVVLGLMVLPTLAVRQYPAIDPPELSIRTEFRGAAAAVVEADVTRKIESAIAGVPGLRRVTSSSFDGRSQVTVEFSLDRGIAEAAADVRAEVARVRGRLPVEADEPVVEKASADSRPVMWFGVTSSASRSQLDLTDLARRTMVDALAAVPGVARVIVAGERLPAMRVRLDAAALAARDLTPNEVAVALRRENLELPAGLITSQTRELSVRAATRPVDAESFRSLVLRGGAQPVRLGEVATVEVGAANDRSLFMIDGQPAVGLGIVRQSTANTLAVSDGVRAAVKRLAATLPTDVSVNNAFDESVFIRAAVQKVVTTLVEAVLAVVVVILLFLRGWRAALIPALAIPVSLLAALMPMAALGFSLNMLTLLAFVLAIGLVVDDAIVVLENAHRRHELGEPALLAAARGTREVGFAVIATTLVLIAVFVPVAMLPGTTGRLFREFGLTLAACVAFSGVVALWWTPMLAARLLSHDANPGRISRALAAAQDALSAGFARVLARALRLRYWVLGGAALLLVGTVWMGLITPSERVIEDQGVVRIQIEAPQGSTLAYTSGQVEAVSALLTPFTGPGGPVERVLVSLPSFTSPGAVNGAMLIVRFRPWEERTVSQQAVVAALQRQVATVPGARVLVGNPPSFGQRDAGVDLQFAMQAEDQASARALATRVQEALMATPVGRSRFSRIFNDADDSRPQLRIELDRDRAAQAGVSAGEVAEALSLLYAEPAVTTWEDRGESYDVILQAVAGDRDAPDALDRILVRSGVTGSLVPLAALVRRSEVGVARVLPRLDRRSAVTVSVLRQPGTTLGECMAQVAEVITAELPAGTGWTWVGQARDFNDSSGGSGQAWILGLALAVVILVLAAQFESWVHPLVILASVPLALGGGLLTLRLAGEPLTIYAQVGLILLVGLVAKNGILLVEFANQLRERGLTPAEAAAQAAAVRFRPILMTSLATIAGAIPLVLASGAGSESMRAIGIVVVGGMAIGTALSLLVTPCLWLVAAPFVSEPGRLARELDGHERACTIPPSGNPL